jgi:hypothetical protein
LEGGDVANWWPTVSWTVKNSKVRLKESLSLQGQGNRRVVERAHPAAQGGAGKIGVNLSQTLAIAERKTSTGG